MYLTPTEIIEGVQHLLERESRRELPKNPAQRRAQLREVRAYKAALKNMSQAREAQYAFSAAYVESWKH